MYINHSYHQECLGFGGQQVLLAVRQQACVRRNPPGSAHPYTGWNPPHTLTQLDGQEAGTHALQTLTAEHFPASNGQCAEYNMVLIIHLVWETLTEVYSL